MTFKHMVLSAVSASGILLALPAIAPAPMSFIAAAQAETNISVNFGYGSFYDRLQPYGNWVSYEDQYVFVPNKIDRGWRPYTLGHWSYTRRYGWLWVSNERFGWATYHYGRWGYSSDIGWYWVPGRRWAPAWVAWSRSDNDIAWAPLPPRYGDDINVNITIGDVPDYYWQAVPTSAFLSINLSSQFIRDRNRVRTMVQQRPPETVRFENNTVINNAVPVNDIERATNTKVIVQTEKPVTNPDAVGRNDPNSVAIFNPDVKTDASVKPKKIFKIDEVISQRKAKGIQPEPVPPEQPVVPGQTLDKAGQPIPPAVMPSAKGQVPVDGKAAVDTPPVNQGKSVVVPLKPMDAGNPKFNAQGKIDAKKGKGSEPMTIQPPPPQAVPVAPPVLKAPAVTVPVVNTPMPKPKREKTFGNAPVGNGNAAPVMPMEKLNNKKLGGQQVAPPVVQPTPSPPKPTDQNASGKKPVGEKGKAKCDPNVEPCPPSQ